MANRFYPLGLGHFAEGGIAWSSDTIKVLLITSSYTPNFTTDEFKSVISGGTIVATSSGLSSKSSTNGVLNAANLTFTAVSGSVASIVVIYKDTGTGSTSPLILYYDTGTGLPVTPNGGDITVNWDTGSFKIGALFEGLSASERKLARRFMEWLKEWKPQPSGILAPATQSILLPSPEMVLRYGG